MNFYDYIDKIIYINLDHRIDRKNEIEQIFKKYEIPEEKIIRLSAIKHEHGNIGCYQSHINALQIAISNKYSNVLILEDDFNFNYDKKNINEIFRDFFLIFENKWNIFQLAWGPSKHVIKIKQTNFYKCERGGCTAGYMVNNNFYDKLMKNYINGIEKLESSNGITYGKNNISSFNIDMHWILLQKETFFWITYLPSIGIIRESYSDILQK